MIQNSEQVMRNAEVKIRQQAEVIRALKATIEQYQIDKTELVLQVTLMNENAFNTLGNRGLPLVSRFLLRGRMHGFEMILRLME